MFLLLLLGLVLTSGEDKFARFLPKDYHEWSLQEAIDLLNDSPWARQETFTKVVGGVGSGISGEKEIYNTFYVRFLSARPIRAAYARIQQIQSGYDKMNAEQKRLLDQAQQPKLNLDVEDWIVVCVGFRSNNPNEESSVRRFFMNETTTTLKSRAFLSTPDFPQVEILAYFPPVEDSVGAKFVFPRELDGRPVVLGEGERVTFELLDVPGAQPRLRAEFPVQYMLRDGTLVM
jgi:hypothetical protein